MKSGWSAPAKRMIPQILQLRAGRFLTSCEEALGFSLRKVREGFCVNKLSGEVVNV